MLERGGQLAEHDRYRVKVASAEDNAGETQEGSVEVRGSCCERDEHGVRGRYAWLRIEMDMNDFVEAGKDKQTRVLALFVIEIARKANDLDGSSDRYLLRAWPREELTYEG